jgi:hypothetical protein
MRRAGAHAAASRIGNKLAGERIGIRQDPAWLRRTAAEPLINPALLCYVGGFATHVSCHCSNAPVSARLIRRSTATS